MAVDIPPRQGEIVRVRSRRYLVEGVEAASQPKDQTLVRLSCLEDDTEGEEPFDHRREPDDALGVQSLNDLRARVERRHFDRTVQPDPLEDRIARKRARRREGGLVPVLQGAVRVGAWHCAPILTNPVRVQVYFL